MSASNHVTLHSGIPRAISREEMAALPIGRYAGEVCLVATAADLQRARADIARQSVVGFDTETRPSFSRGESYAPCLAQVATAGTVYLFQLRRTEALPVVAELLAHPRTVKAGVAVADDLRPLRRLFHFTEKNVLDLGVVARQRGFSQTGLRNLAGILLGIRIPKGVKTSNWAAPSLSAAQITYAATDAWACRELFLRFQALGLLRD